MNNAATDQDRMDAFLSRDEEAPDRLHDCCPICDLELCLADPHPRFGACPCGMPRADEHEGSCVSSESASGKGAA